MPERLAAAMLATPEALVVALPAAEPFSVKVTVLPEIELPAVRVRVA